MKRDMSHQEITKSDASLLKREPFEILYTQIESLSDELKMQSAEACLEGDFVQAKKLGDKHEELLTYRKKLEKFERQWAMWKASVSNPKTDKKEADSSLRIVFDDEVIELRNSEETFIAALKKIGIDAIAQLDKQIDGIPLVRPIVEGTEDDTLENKWHIASDLDDKVKRKTLKEISKKLNIPLLVDLA